MDCFKSEESRIMSINVIPFNTIINAIKATWLHSDGKWTSLELSCRISCKFFLWLLQTSLFLIIEVEHFHSNPRCWISMLKLFLSLFFVFLKDNEILRFHFVHQMNSFMHFRVKICWVRNLLGIFASYFDVSLWNSIECVHGRHCVTSWCVSFQISWIKLRLSQ